MGIMFQNVDEASAQRAPAVLGTTDAVGELQQTYTQTLNRKQLLTSFDWDVNDIAYKTLYRAEFPRNGVKGTVFRAIYDMFVMARSRVRFTIQLQSNPFQQGQLICGWAPLTRAVDFEIYNETHPNSLLVAPHVMLTAGATRSAELTVEFAHPKKFLDWEDFEDELGTFYVAPFNVLKVDPEALGAQQVAKISIYVSYPDAEMKILNPGNVITPPSVSRPIENFTATPQGNVSYTNIKSGGAVDYSSSADSAADVQGSLDKPNYGGEVPRFVRSSFPDVATCTNNSTIATTLDYDPGRKSLAKAGDFGTTDSETNIEFLANKKTLLTKVRWTTVEADGHVLYFDRLLPNPNMLGALVGTEIEPTLAGYLSRPFAFWKADLIATVQVVGSKFHTGRLAVCSHYGRQSDWYGENNLIDAMGQYAAVMDMSENSTTMEVVFPYRAQTGMLETRDWEVPINWNESKRYLMGEWSLRVVNSLRAPEGVAQEVDINIFWSMKNVSFDFPRQIPLSIEVINPFFDAANITTPNSYLGFEGRSVPSREEEKFEAKPQMESSETKSQALISDDAPANVNDSNDESVELAPPSTSSPPIDRQIVITDITDLCKRQSVIRDEITPSVLSAVCGELFIGRGGLDPLPDGGPIRFFSPMYRLWKGSFVFTLSAKTDTIVAWSPFSWTDPEDLLSSAFGPAGTHDKIVGMGPVTQVLQSAGLQTFKIPFQSQYHVLAVPRSELDVTQPQASSFVLAIKSEQADTYGKLYVGGGDDFRLGQHYFVPHLRRALVP